MLEVPAAPQGPGELKGGGGAVGGPAIPISLRRFPPRADRGARLGRGRLYLLSFCCCKLHLRFCALSSRIR